MKASWQTLPFQSVFEELSAGNVKTLQSEYKTVGKFAVVDQGKNLVAGYVDDPTRLCKVPLPAIVFGDHTRIFKYVDFPFCMGADGTKVLRPRFSADERYLYYYLRSLDVAEAGYARHFRILKRTKITLPPLEEQRRIAAILDKADSLRQKRRAALQKLDSLTQSLFLDMFGDFLAPKSQHARMPLEKLCSIPSSLVDPTEGRFRNMLHWGPDRIAKDSGEMLLASSAADDRVESPKFVFDDEHVLYSKIRPALNKVGLPSVPGLCSADIYPLRAEKDVATREFLWALLRSSDFLAYASTQSNRANIPKLNREELLAYPAICPPYEQQKRFSSEVLRIKNTRIRFVEALTHVNRLVSSIQNRAFRGEL